MQGQRPKMERFVIGLLLLCGLLDLVYRLEGSEITVCNSGIAFGIVLPETLLWVGLAVLLVGVSWQLGRVEDEWERLAWSAILIGGVVNGFDRFLEGCVRDYFTLGPFPSFNVADMMLLLGVLYLLGRMSGIFSTRKLYVS